MGKRGRTIGELCSFPNLVVLHSIKFFERGSGKIFFSKKFSPIIYRTRLNKKNHKEKDMIDLQSCLFFLVSGLISRVLYVRNHAAVIYL